MRHYLPNSAFHTNMSIKLSSGSDILKHKLSRKKLKFKSKSLQIIDHNLQILHALTIFITPVYCKD